MEYVSWAYTSTMRKESRVGKNLGYFVIRIVMERGRRSRIRVGEFVVTGPSRLDVLNIGLRPTATYASPSIMELQFSIHYAQ